MNHKEGRKEFTKKFIETIASGYVLTMKDVRKDAPKFGYAESSIDSVFKLVEGLHFDSRGEGDQVYLSILTGWESQPIKIIDTRYRNRRIVYSATLNVEDTDLVKVKARIDAEINSRRK